MAKQQDVEDKEKALHIEKLSMGIYQEYNRLTFVRFQGVSRSNDGALPEGRLQLPYSYSGRWL